MRKYPWIVCGLLFPLTITAQSISSPNLTAEDFYQKATKLIASAQYDTASDYLTESLSLDKQNREARFLRAEAYFQSGKYHKALIDLEKVLKADQTNSEALGLKAQILAELGEADQEISSRIALHDLVPSLENSLRLGTLYAQLENAAEAQFWFEQVLSEDEDHAEAVTALEALSEIKKGKTIEYSIANGLAFLESQQWDKAQLICQDYVARHPEDPQGYYCLSQAFQNQNQYTSALSFIKKAIELDPSIEEAFLQLGELHFHFGNYQSAAQAYQKALANHPGHAKASYRLEQCRLHLQDTEQVELSPLVQKNTVPASKTYERLIQVEGADYLSKNSRGKGYQMLGQHRAAIEAFSAAISQKPDFAESYFNRGYCYYELKEFNQSILDFSKALKLNAEYAVAHLMRAQAYLQLNQFSKALDDLNQSLSIQPQNAKALLNRSAIFYTLGQYQNAIEDLDKAILLHPDNASLWANRGNIFLLRKQYHLARRDFQKAIALQKDDAKLHYYSAAAAMHMKRFDQALKDAQLALNILDKNQKGPMDQGRKISDFWIEVTYLNGYLFHQTGQLAEGEAAYTEVLKRRHDYAEVWYNRALLRHQRNKLTEACSDIQQAISLGFTAEQVQLLADFCQKLTQE